MKGICSKASYLKASVIVMGAKLIVWRSFRCCWSEVSEREMYEVVTVTRCKYAESYICVCSCSCARVSSITMQLSLFVMLVVVDGIDGGEQWMNAVEMQLAHFRRRMRHVRICMYMCMFMYVWAYIYVRHGDGTDAIHE